MLSGSRQELLQEKFRKIQEGFRKAFRKVKQNSRVRVIGSVVSKPKGALPRSCAKETQRPCNEFFTTPTKKQETARTLSGGP